MLIKRHEVRQIQKIPMPEHKFHKIITAELKEGIFVGTQIREIQGSLIDSERRGLGKLKVGLFKLLT